MNKGFIILAIMCIMLAGLFHMVFTMFDYGFNNPDTGAFTRIREIQNETLTGSFKDDAYANNVMLDQFFGYGRIILIAMCVIFIAAGALPNKEGGG